MGKRIEYLVQQLPSTRPELRYRDQRELRQQWELRGNIEHAGF